MKTIPFKVVILMLIIVAVALGGVGVYLYIISNRSESSTDTPTLTLGCPVPDEYCENYEKIEGGFGYKLERDTKIYTAAAGTLNFGKVSRLNEEGKAEFLYNSVRIISPLGYHIDCYFSGSTATPATYNAPVGAYIGKAGAELEEFGGGEFNLVIQVTDPETGESPEVYPSR